MHSLAFTRSTLSSRPHILVLSYSFPCFLFISSFFFHDQSPSRPVLLYLLTGSLSLLYRPIFHHSEPPRSRATTRRRQSGSLASTSPRASFEFNYSSSHYTRKGQKLRWYNYFLSRAFVPLYRRLNTTVVFMFLASPFVDFNANTFLFLIFGYYKIFFLFEYKSTEN